jgi:hypothetical protein
MAAITFPENPVLNQQFLAGDYAFQWNGAAWIGISVSPEGLEGATGATGAPGQGGVVGVNTQGLSGFSHVEISDSLGVGVNFPGTDAKAEIVNPFNGNASDKPVLSVIQDNIGEDNLIQDWQFASGNKFRLFSNSTSDYGLGVYAPSSAASQEQAYSIYNGTSSQGIEFFCGTGTFDNTWKKFGITPSGNYDRWGNTRTYASEFIFAEFTPGFYESGRLFRIITTVDVNIEYDGALEGGWFVKIVNETDSNVNIKQSPGNTMYHTVDGSTGDRILAPRGLCTIYCSEGSEFYIEGGGVT